MPQFPQVFAGAAATAGLLQKLAPFTVIKPADQSVTSSVTLVNDSALALPLAANGSWLFACFLKYEGGTAGAADLKWAFTGPSGFGMNYELIGNAAGGASALGFLRGIPGSTAGTSGAGNAWGMFMFGTVTTGSTAGTLQLQWAQNTSNATATIVHAGSALALIEAS